MGTTEAERLRQLAKDVRHLLDEPIRIAADKDAKPDDRWQGPNATKVRGELSVRKGRLDTMADAIEREATKRMKDEGKKGD
ncbi:hypothetical protein ACQUSR_19135 [Streptomyces sp. P1-3]|uniref:hypothetical protein n=1 Tax=Streptomyces sp. P1-3 TaxID=3421658 RepID=UPI003D36D22F